MATEDAFNIHWSSSYKNGLFSLSRYTLHKHSETSEVVKLNHYLTLVVLRSPLWPDQFDNLNSNEICGTSNCQLLWLDTQGKFFQEY